MIKRNRKVPFIGQLTQTECGLSCIAMILRYYGSNETLSDLRKYTPTGRDGLRILDLNNLLKKMNFHTKVYKTNVGGLSQLKLPAILYWNNNHYVVLEKMKKKYYIIVDPAFGRKKIAFEELEKSFTKFVITCLPKQEFTPSKKKKSMWFIFLPDIIKNKFIFFKIIILALISYLISISSPIIVQILIDDIILKNKINLLHKYASILFILMAFGSILMYFRGKKQIDLEIVLNESIMTKTFYKLLKVPYKFFEVRNTGDLLFRLNSLSAIKDLLSFQVIRGLIDFGALIFILIYMLYKSVILTMAAILFLLINCIFMYFNRLFLMEATQYEISENSKLQGIQVETLCSMFDIKVTAMEDGVFNTWKDKLKNYMYRYKNRSRLSNIYNTITDIMNNISPLIMLFMGVIVYSYDYISLGGIIAFYSISTTFFSRGSSMVQLWNNIVLTNAYLERIRDITDAEIEENINSGEIRELKGDIKLKNVSFAYTINSEEVIKNISIHIKSGQKIGIVGSSGAGKSTLSKILLGIYTPTKGKIFFDDLELNSYCKKSLRKQIGVVPQEISLFNKSILDNIRVSNKNISLNEVKKAAKIAQIHDEIEEMPMKYYTIISNMGMNLSGGQRQRIALARAILNNPRIVVLDEATSSLDSINESNVSNYFKAIGCTRIVIAHRLSTIIDSDIIFVMNNGEIVESGIHEELIKKKGFYSNLYSYQNYNGLKNSEKNLSELSSEYSISKDQL